MAGLVKLLLSVRGIGVVAKTPGVPVLLGVAILIGLVFDADRTGTDKAAGQEGPAAEDSTSCSR